MLPSRFFYDNFLDDVNMKGMDCDIYLKEGIYHLEIDVPGFNKEDLHVEVNKGVVLVKAEKNEVQENNDKKYLRHERKYNKLERSFSFSDIDEDSIKAEFKNGTLHLTINKKVVDTKKQITID